MGSLKLQLGLAVIGVACGAALLYVVYKKGPAAVAAAAQEINPLNPNNIFTRGASAVVESVTDGRALSIGDAVYQIFNKDDAGAIATAPSYVYGPDWNMGPPAPLSNKYGDYAPASVYDMPGQFYP